MCLALGINPTLMMENCSRTVVLYLGCILKSPGELSKNSDAQAHPITIKSAETQTLVFLNAPLVVPA